MISRNRESVNIEVGKFDTDGLPERYFNKGELEALLTLYQMAKPEVIVEFGVNTGRNVVAAFRNITGLKKYIGVDVPPGYVTHMPVQRKEIPAEPGELAKGIPGFELIIKPRGTLDLTHVDFGEEADVVFIDADHSRIGVENDFNLALSILKPGGMIIFHDDNCLPSVEVTQTLNDFVEDGYDIKHINGTWLSYWVHE